MKLKDIAKVIRSKNAGPFYITLDVIFSGVNTYQKVKAAGALNAELIASLYNVETDLVGSRCQNGILSQRSAIRGSLASG